MQKTISVKAVNSGPVGQVLRVPGGTVEVRSGETLDAVDILAPTDSQIAHYKERGVTFEEVKAKKSSAKQTKTPSPDLAALETEVEKKAKAVEDAAKGAEADSSDANMAALAQAKADLDAAQKALDAAKSA